MSSSKPLSQFVKYDTNNYLVTGNSSRNKQILPLGSTKSSTLNMMNKQIKIAKHVRVHVCLYVGVCLYAGVCLSVCLCVGLCPSVCVCLCAGVCLSVCGCLFVYMQVSVCYLANEVILLGLLQLVSSLKS